jgi:hypothetical protein
LRDAVDGRHENDGEESTDVEDEEFFFEGVGEGEEKKDSDGEEDVAADKGAGSILLRCEVIGLLSQLDSPGCSVLDAESMHFWCLEWKCGAGFCVFRYRFRV